MKMFPKFGKRTVGIQNCDGTWFECKMLGVADNDIFEEILQEMYQVAAGENREAELKALVKARRKLINLIKKVLPAEKHEELERFEFDEAAALVRYLLFGTGDTEGDSKKKVSYQQTEKKKRNWITTSWRRVFSKRSLPIL
ncbi:MAG: hypothetical protein WCI51_08300 [Lentisphaerota bacterium]